jgi:PAS domain S-box-containing protein
MMGQMDTIVKIGAIRPCSLDQMVRTDPVDSTPIKTSSWEWMFRVLKAAVEHATEGIIMLDLNGIIRYANEETAKAHGYTSRAQLLGRDLAALHTPQQMQEHVTSFVTEAMRLGSLEGPLEHVTRDGVIFNTDTKMKRVRNEAGDDVGLIIFHMNMAELEEVEAAPAAQVQTVRAQPAPAEVPPAPESPVPAAFCEKLTQPVAYRYTAGEQITIVPEPAPMPQETKVTASPSAAAAQGPASAPAPAHVQAGDEGADPYLELRKANGGGPLDTTKLADLAELLKRLG